MRQAWFQMDKDDFAVVCAINDEARRIATGTGQDKLTGSEGFPVWGVLPGGPCANPVVEDRIVVLDGRALAAAGIGQGVRTKQIPKEAAFKEREVPLIVRR